MRIKDLVTETLDTKESRKWTTDQWSQWLDQHIAAGEISKKDWTDAKQVLGRLISIVSDKVRDELYLAPGKSREGYEDLYYGSPGSLSELKKAEKIAGKSPDGPFKTAILDIVSAYKPLRDKLEELKPLVVTATQKRDTAKQQQATQKTAEKGASAALVEALKEHKLEYVEEARKQSLAFITNLQKKVKDSGGIDAVAPIPSFELRKTDQQEYDKLVKKRNTLKVLIDADPKKYANDEAAAAEESYDIWTYKLIQKIGKPVVQASVSGDPWRSSIITVKTADGETQSWNTQMIFNTSKLGKVFNQFPTRRLK